MTVEFYVHTGQIKDMNERHAIYLTAQTLLNEYADDSDLYLFIANIDPDQDPEFRKASGLTQLDGVLLGPNIIAIVDFKNYFDPIDARKLTRRWHVRTKHKRQVIKGGNHKNPYYQAQNARRVWHNYLKTADSFLFDQSHNKSWEAFYAFILFHPALHPDSRLPDIRKDHYWFRLGSVGDIAKQVFAAGSSQIWMSPEQIRSLAKEGFRAKPWVEMTRLLQDEIGFLNIQEPGDKAPLKVHLWQYDDFTIGRSRKHGNRLKLDHGKISRAHARITVKDKKVYIYDLGSKNGTFINNHPIDHEAGHLLTLKDVAQLGGTGENTTKIWFELKKRIIPSEITTLGTE